jgi:uncharacterized protein YbjT (DUF2867 family)
MPARLPLETLVTVFGGSGFLGRHLVRTLARNDLRVRAAVRRPDLAGHLQPLGRVGQIHSVQANVRYPASIDAAVRGASVVINLVGVLYERGNQSFQAVHADGAAAVAEAAKAEGARLIHVSALGVRPDSASLYAQSKAAGEAAVLATIPDATIFRPSVLFGPEDDFFNKFAGLARFLPVLPLIGGGETRFRPVFVGDVAQAIMQAVDGTARAGIYEVGGPDVLTLRQIYEFVLKTVERRRFLVPLPFPLALLQARVLQFLPTPPLTPDQVELLRDHNVVSPEAEREGRTLAGLGIEPTPISSVVPTYLWRFRARGEFRNRAA